MHDLEGTHADHLFRGRSNHFGACLIDVNDLPVKRGKAYKLTGVAHNRGELAEFRFQSLALRYLLSPYRPYRLPEESSNGKRKFHHQDRLPSRIGRLFDDVDMVPSRAENGKIPVPNLRPSPGGQSSKVGLPVPIPRTIIEPVLQGTVEIDMTPFLILGQAMAGRCP